MYNVTPLEQPCEVGTAHRAISIGLPAHGMTTDYRFPLTPEAVAILVDKGLRLKMQAGAASPIHYTDADYVRAGSEIVERTEALQCDIVVQLSELTVADINQMRKGAILFTLYQSYCGKRSLIDALIARSVITLAIDLVEDGHGNKPIADVLQEVDGRAAIALASAMQADPVNGKGILMGGVAGIVPCEITLLGSGIAACAAARSAVGLGATVRMFDNDVYRLRSAMAQLGVPVIGSAMHPHVLEGALRSADVVIATPMRHAEIIGTDLVDVMKRRAIVIDITNTPGQVFPSMQSVDLNVEQSLPVSDRSCCYNVSGRVPRTVAMALSNALITLFDDILTGAATDSTTDLVKMLPGVQPAVLTIFGKLVNASIATSVGLRSTDLSIYLSLS